ncbi:MAG: RNA polymerase sigma factor [Planctomycetota bacterium]|jgi:RNA polymerase sigma-70 factor (ECF subfamily)
MAGVEAELDLIARAVAGDAFALERLLLAYYDRLCRRVARKLPVRLRGTVAAEDILQQTFVEAFQGIGSFRPQGKWAFYRWLVTIADHRLQDAVKAQRAAKRGGGRADADQAAKPALESTDELIELLAGPHHTPSQSAARHEAVGAVQVALASLKADHRRALELRYFQGLPAAEVAKAMNRTPHAVHNLCHRGLKELRAVLGRSSQFFTRK